jgi:hypothetical protein
MAKKSATNKKSPNPQPAAKKAAAKKTAAKKTASKASGKAPAEVTSKASTKAAGKPSKTITEGDWAQIYAKAWLDDAFRTLLETDPTAALKQYAKENGLPWTKLVQVPQPAGATAAGDPDENCIHLVSCC